ncbi:cobamide remodeling phosphodiesterase CbiR [Desulfonatronum sp. SC1]|uniref:cobamide remodeling phosphodiesterase CbiR n=1 Tax=Desulfonatronum sp. SC1 TaxID=2109626 RepID=UPI000D2F4C41|nr:cobamide remodeling phosphodiesterase CbiR [Desulfonatronum sp. SC1]PTN32734.1 hypothetical protein C6366_15915 [Desulfonatronum sp. SC1]
MNSPQDIPHLVSEESISPSCSGQAAPRLCHRFNLQHARIAGPSFVWPADVAENCRRLAPLVDEVGLLFFESEACLVYTERDLPPWLAETGLRFHAHLPLDLPWNEGPERVWEIVSGLRRKAAFLRPWAFVLHPPETRPDFIDLSGRAEVCPQPGNDVAFGQGFGSFTEFVHLWGQRWEQGGGRPEELLLENTRENDLVDSWPLIQSVNLGICLDLGHLLVHGQQTHRLPEIWSRVRMVHLSAPGKVGEDGRPRDGHRSLAELDHRGRGLLEEILGRIRPDCVLMLEVFEPEGFMESLNMLRGMTGRA